MPRGRTVSLALLASLLIAAPATAQSVQGTIDLAPVYRCGQLLPAAFGAGSQPIDFDVRIVYDADVHPRVAEQIVKRGSVAFRRISMFLQPSYTGMTLSSTSAQGIIEEVRTALGGTRPPGIEVVYILTTKDITDPWRGSSVAGAADCNGGIAWPDRGFVVGETSRDSQVDLPLTRLGVDLAAKVFAHEVAHALGAEHHYSNCVQGLIGSINVEPDAPCSLMWEDIGLRSLTFGSVERWIVRGYTGRFRG